MPPSMEQFRQRVANIAIGPSTLRNQGAPGVNALLRAFLTRLNLTRFVSEDESVFRKELDRQTVFVIRKLPKGAQHWGAARKAINLFLAEAYYHRFLCKEYHLARIEKFLEVPLDRQVAKFLINKARTMSDSRLPRWRGIKHLTPTDSRRYQDFANDYATTLADDWARVHRGVIMWRSNNRD